ncbi:hypothetical protein BJ878DRAFT_546286 [Calycina marina]|uniref:Secreted protein n=1 Tax=Calycina marina TaxID=1763456 RepID=A0A9P8CBB2_9HELO|nr:hypothetical protein BJ878DRAFT_546286 [Calycina marina]
MQLPTGIKTLIVVLLASNGATNKLSPPICNNAGSYTDVTSVGIAINHLRSRGGRTYAAPRNCAHLVCVGGAEILLCNDSDRGISPANDYLATYAIDIDQSCTIGGGLGHPQTKGQLFDSDGYNVVVRKGNC